jgi:hypothetical protein
MKSLVVSSAGLLALSFLAAGARAQSDTPDAATPDKPIVHISSVDQDATELAKKLQNPIGDFYSFRFQGNTNFNTGTKGGTQENLNVQPVIPIHINDDFTLITRTILPLVWQPSFEPAHTVPFGTAPTEFSALLANANPIDRFVFGVGPIFGCRRPAARRSARMSEAPGRRSLPSIFKAGQKNLWATSGSGSLPSA